MSDGSSGRPNVLWIGLDQIRSDSLGCHGNEICETPAMDQLAERGVRFTNAYTPCSLCTPARASMFTGLYAFKHGMGTNCDMYHSLSAELAHPESLLHHIFTDAGYRCGYAGKWHVGTDKGPADFGFEGMSLPGYGNIREDSGFKNYLDEEGLKYEPVPELYLNPDKQTLVGGKWGGPQESTPSHYLTNFAIDMIDQYGADDSPFFITCQYWGPHGPHMPSDEFYGRYDRSQLPPWPNFSESLESKPKRVRRERDWFYRDHAKTWEVGKEILGLYYDCVTMIDYEVGRLLAHLTESGLAGNTIVILSADHGDMTASHGGLMDKGLLYQEAHHIPLIFSWDGVWSASVAGDLAMNMDIMPTLMDACGLELPGNLDGCSLLPVLEGETERAKRDALLLEFHGLRFLYSQRAIVTDDGWKYIFTPGDDDEVYNLNEDPYEMRNLAADSGCADRVHRLRDRLRRAVAEADDPLRDCVSKFFGIWSTDSGQIDATKFFDDPDEAK